MERLLPHCCWRRAPLTLRWEEVPRLRVADQTNKPETARWLLAQGDHHHGANEAARISEAITMQQQHVRCVTSSRPLGILPG
eukprot:scaffold8167_cov444-Prasinococcus_capsulatus_cf.AAC.3